ncbi:Mut7-C RNAse domain-containing protein [Massilia niastensis]|uniref:Mut7-C RNAse domain-containing protein n=1 Tax=Massilia niastensis TaxID=544911 RepID=UPI00037CC542|nr:Mut7-C RNAse domain-containing protein [Massilia niastensis]
MVTAIFRFHEELNDFLPRERRGRPFASGCARDATVKHMIEALGVPHTEVELVLVNGQESGFERRVEDGDRIAVYSRFELIEFGPHESALQEKPVLDRLRDRPLARMRFIADAHLGGLARLLRMAGFDTLYDNHYHDDEIEDIAQDADRVVLTRDRELLKRRAILHGCYIHALDPAQQLRELFARLDLAQGARPFTRCLDCNVPLRPVDKASVFHRLPQSVRTLQHSFTTCDICQRVYWKGTHYQRMNALLASLGSPDEGTPERRSDIESSKAPDFPSLT